MEAFRSMVTGWLGKTLLVLLIVPFAIVGVESYFSGGSKVIAASINGHDITQAQVDELVERQKQMLLARMGESADPALLNTPLIRKQVLDGLIDRELLSAEAKKMGYLISDATIYKLIRDIPAFQENGEFSQLRYEETLRQMNKTPASYLQEARQELSYSLLLSGMGQSGFLAAAEISRISALDGQVRDIHIATIPAARFLSGVSVSDADSRQFYETNAVLFTAPETVSLEYIRLVPSDFAAKVSLTDDEIAAKYQEKVQALAQGEQRKAQHILINVDDKTKDADALKKIQQLEQRVKKGEDFAKLAKEFSQDTGSVASGGDLGFVGRGQFVPEFEKTLFALKKGQVSAPVKTQYGYHLIKLNDIQSPTIPTLASLKPEIEKELKAAKQDEAIAQQVDKIDAAVYEASDLNDPAQAFGLKRVTLPPFTRTEKLDGLAADKKVREMAFSDELVKEGKNSQSIHLEDGSVVWLRVAQHQPESKLPFEQVKSDVQNRVLIQKAAAKAKEVAESFAKQLNNGSNLSEIAKQAASEWKAYPNATRRTALPSGELLLTAYSLPRPKAGQVSAAAVLQGNSYALVAISRVQDAEPKASDVAQLRTVLADSSSREEIQDYLQSLRANAKVKIRQETQATE